MNMRTFFIAAALMVCGFCANANDTIRMTWLNQENYTYYTKAFGVTISNGGQWTVDWGDGSPIDTNICTHVYNNLTEIDGGHTVTIIAISCQFKEFNCKKQQIRYIDMQCPLLEVLYCDSNILSNLDGRNIQNLTYLNCFHNQLRILDISNNPNLTHLECTYNQLDRLDLSKNINIKGLGCSFNQLSSLSLHSKIMFIWVDCVENHLQLSDLYNVCKKSGYSQGASLGTQRLDLQKIKVNEKVDYSAQNQFQDINNAWIKTTFIIEKNELPTSDYSMNEGIITFKDTGTYTVTMTNKALISDWMYPAKVITKFNVIKDSIPDSTNIVETIQGIITIYPNPTTDQLIISLAGGGKGVEELTIEKIEIYNVVGQMLYQINKSTNNQINNEISIDVSHLEKGIYFVKIGTKDGIQHTKKIIKY